MLFKSYLAVCCKHSCSIDKPARLHSASLHSYLIDSFCLASSGIQIFQRSILTQFFINEDVISGLSRITATVSTYKHSMPYLLSDNRVQCIFPDLRAILDWWAMPETVCSTLSMFWGKRYPSQSNGPDFFIQRNIFLLGKNKVQQQGVSPRLSFQGHRCRLSSVSICGVAFFSMTISTFNWAILIHSDLW